jgi:four helix bundle protein
MFSHEKLKVYEKALVSVANLARCAASWDKRHAVVDQLLRASESVVMNIAEGARLLSTGHKQHLMDYAIGSALESGACLDIAVLKQFLTAEAGLREKRLLCEIVKMLVGLRRAWGHGALREAPPPYHPKLEALFPHERLDVYQTGLSFLRWFNALRGGKELSSRLYRQVDKAATSVVLNIAEANGRFPHADRQRFHDVSEASAVKAAAYLDLCVQRGQLDPTERGTGVQLLARIALMLRGLSQG